MNSNDDWSGHPIFVPNANDTPFELSTQSLGPSSDGPAPSGRRQIMLLKDADILVAMGKELRITSLGDPKSPGNSPNKSYKTLHTPNIQFDIHQMSLNPTGKLLAVAGAFQVAVVVLPRTGLTKLVPLTVDCKSVQVGQFYHASKQAAPIAKIEWHPWGEAGSALMVMTADGKLREYDISVDTEEPQQVLSFVPEKRSNSFLAEDATEREVASFTLGQGKADWGPLTIYAVMKSGDIYAICPYMPQNASIPSAYIHSLECFISAKQEYLSQGTSETMQNLSSLYDYQHKYVSALVKQLPAGTVFPAASRSVQMHPPTTIKSQTVRQGPFLLQPSPRLLDGSEGGDATDIAYLTFGTDDQDESQGETEHLGVLLVAFQDGKVDLCLDVDKVEARWERKQHPSNDLPMLAVYETIDLGLISSLTQMSTLPNQRPALDLLQKNYPVLLPDPIHDDTIYIYHSFGVHALHLDTVLQCLAVALREDDDEDGATLQAALSTSASTAVQSILTTFSVERRCSNPVIAVCVPNDIYVNYSIFMLTSAMRIASIPLSLRSESPTGKHNPLLLDESEEATDKFLIPAEGQPAYVSLLGKESFVPPPTLSRPFGLPSNPRIAVGSPGGKKNELLLTPDTMRFLGTTAERLTTQIIETQIAYKAIETRTKLQQSEFTRQQTKCREMLSLIEVLKNSRRVASEEKMARVQNQQRNLMTRLDRMLQRILETASPDLSEYETKWFEELGRMKEEIQGAGKYDEGSLASRFSLLEKEYARLLPSLKALLDKEHQRKQKNAETNQALGASQAFAYGERSSIERIKITALEQKLLNMATKLDLPLSQMPK